MSCLKGLFLFLFLLLSRISAVEPYQLRDIKVNELDYNKIDGETFKCSFKTTRPSIAVFQIYDQSGSVVFQEKSKMLSSSHQFEWDFKSNNKELVKSGLYFYRIEHKSEDGVWDSYNRTFISGGVDVKSHWPRWDKKTKIASCRLTQDAIVYFKGFGERNEVLFSNWKPQRRGRVAWDLSHLDIDETINNFELASIKLPTNTIIVNLPNEQNFSNFEWLKNAYYFQKLIGEESFSFIEKYLNVSFYQKNLMTYRSPNEIESSELIVNKNKLVTLDMKIDLDLNQELGMKYSLFQFVGSKYIDQSPLEVKEFSIDLDTKGFDKGSHTLSLIIVQGIKIIDFQKVKFKND